MSNTTAVPSGARHPVNIGHLVMGLAFAGLLGVWALIVGDVVDGDDIRWLLPLPWVFAGAIGLLAVTLATHRRMAQPGPAFAEPTDSTDLLDTPDSTDSIDTTDTEEIR
jgi:hypothetical protein